MYTKKKNSLQLPVLLEIWKKKKRHAWILYEIPVDLSMRPSDGRTLNEILFQVFGFLMKVQGIAPEGLSPAIKKKKEIHYK